MPAHANAREILTEQALEERRKRSDPKEWLVMKSRKDTYGRKRKPNRKQREERRKRDLDAYHKTFAYAYALAWDEAIEQAKKQGVTLQRPEWVGHNA